MARRISGHCAYKSAVAIVAIPVAPPLFIRQQKLKKNYEKDMRDMHDNHTTDLFVESPEVIVMFQSPNVFPVAWPEKRPKQAYPKFGSIADQFLNHESQFDAIKRMLA
jgi:hypothetical protein